MCNPSCTDCYIQALLSTSSTHEFYEFSSIDSVTLLFFFFGINVQLPYSVLQERVCMYWRGVEGIRLILILP